MNLVAKFKYVLVLWLTACTVSVPEIKNHEGKQLSETELIQQLLSHYKISNETQLQTNKVTTLPEIGELTSYGVEVDKTLKNAFHHFYSGRYQDTLIAIEGYQNLHRNQPLYLFQASFLKTQALIALGRTSAAEKETFNTAKLEQQLFKTEVNSLALRGEALLWLDEWDKAIALLMQVADQTQDWILPDFYLAPPSNLGELFNTTTAQLRAYTVIATAYLQKGEFEHAKPWAQLAEAAYKRVFDVFEHKVYGQFIPLHADAYYGRAINLGVLAATRLVVDNQAKEAQALFASGKHFLNKVGFQNAEIILDSFYAQALVKAKDCEQADKVALTTIRQASERGMIDMLWRIQTQRGMCLFEKGQLHKAEQAFRDALKASNFISTQLRSDGAKRRFGVGKEDIVNHLITIDLKKHNLENLFADMELGRARAFVEMLAGHPVAIARQPQLTQQIADLDKKIDSLRFINASTFGGDVDSITKERQLITERAAKIIQLQQQDPELAQTIAAKQGSSLYKIQGLLKTGEMLIYVLPDYEHSNINLLIINPKHVSLKTLAINHQQLAQTLKQFRAAVEQGREQLIQQQQLLNLLNRQLQIADWGMEQALYVVPSGELHFIPWGGLDINIPIAVLPMANWLQRGENNGDYSSKPVIVGDPEFYGQLEQLEGARVEAAMIASLYQHKALLGKEATLANIRTAIGNKTPILHLATHAYFDHEKPLNSALVLTGRDQAYLLTAAELFEEPLSASLVVLSACESGSGQAVSGDDVLGLSRSFYLGGSDTILNSLWPIEDQGTMKFMQVFHSEAMKGDYGNAWLSARNHLKREGFPPSVYGAFILGGMMRFR